MIKTVKNTERLGTEQIGKLLFEFSMPAILGMLVNLLYNTVDRIYIGRGVDPLGIAGISIAMPLMMVGTALALLIGAGSNSIFSIRLGEGHKDEAEKIMGHAFILLLLTSALFVIVAQVFLNPITIHILGASEAIMPYAKCYLRIILCGAVFNTMGTGLNFFIRSDGHPRTSMYTQMIGAFINIILDPIFIFVFKWGIAGAAWATIIAQFVSFAWVMLYFNSKSTQLRFRIKQMKPEIKLSFAICSLGLAPFSRQIAMSFVLGIMNRSLYFYGGDIAVTAMGIVYSILSFFLMPLQGLTQGSQPIIGYNYGAKSYDRVRKTYLWTILCGFIFTVIALTFLQLFPQFLFCIFTIEKGELLETGTKCMRISTLLLPIVSFQMISANYFQSVGKPVQSILMGLSRQVFGYIPLLLLLPRVWGLNGVFYAMPVSDLLSAILAFVLIMHEKKRLEKLIQIENMQTL
ncbi:MAG: MATE family efflux transporter [Firmicutes bacterium]|nr:MATE family efflux transporter [Bacillota bacterium]